MRTSSYIIEAGARVEIAASGNYVRVRKSAVELIIENGESNERVEVSEGDDFTFKPFKNLYVTNTGATTENIKLTISTDQKAGSAKVGGSVAIIGAVELGAPSLAALENITAIAGGQIYGAGFKSVNTLAANTAETVFTAAANVNGAIIHSAQFMDINGSTTLHGHGGFLANATAPTTVTNGDPVLSADGLMMYSAGATASFASLKNPVRVPAGKGLFYFTSVLQINGSHRSVLYTLL